MSKILNFPRRTGTSQPWWLPVTSARRPAPARGTSVLPPLRRQPPEPPDAA